MTELFTLMALGAAFGWMFSKMTDPPRPVYKTSAFPDPAKTHIDKIRSKIQMAETYLNNKSYFEGLTLFKELRKEILSHQENFSLSEKIGINTSLKLCLEQVADGLITQKVYNQALPLLEEAAGLDPDDIDILKKIVRLNLALGEKDKATKNLKKILKKDPSFLPGYRRLGKIYIENMETEKALKIYNEAIINFQEETRVRLEMLEKIALSTPESHPEKIKALKNWSEELIKDKNLPRAKEIIEKALNIYPEDIALKIELSKVNYKLGKLNEARHTLEEIKEENAENLEAKYYLGATFFKQKEIDRALSYFNQIINFYDSISDLPDENKAEKLQNFGMPGKNIAEITGSFHSLLYPAIAMAGEIYRRRGMVDEAEKLFMRLLEKGSKFIDKKNLEYFDSLSVDFNLLKDEREYFWKEQIKKLHISINKKKASRNSYEDFWLNFQPSEPEESDIIGEGGMALVYRGTDLKTKRKVAIKKMHRQFCLDPGAISFFHREVSAMEALSYPEPHPNIVEFIAHGISDERFVFAMELVDGKSLREKLLAGEINRWEDILSIINQICSGLKRAHEDEKRIIHRDLKPENILITEEGIVKLTDFGICRVSSLSTSTRHHYRRTRSFVGTSYYSAPEQYPNPFDGKLPPIDHRADIYSLGCIIYEMLTTQTPFVHTDPGIVGLMHQRRNIENISGEIIPPGMKNPLLINKLNLKKEQLREIDCMVLKCLKKIPGARYQSVDEIKEELLNISQM